MITELINIFFISLNIKILLYKNYLIKKFGKNQFNFVQKNYNVIFDELILKVDLAYGRIISKKNLSRKGLGMIVLLFKR